MLVEPMLLSDLPFRVLGQAFWRPQALKGGRLPDASASDASNLRTVDGLHVRWRAEESWVNHAVDSLFGALPPAAIAQMMGELFPGMAVEPLVPSTCQSAALKTYLGVPDLFFVGRGHAVAGEIKIGAKSSNGRYSFEQYTKYLTLTLLLRASRRTDLPRSCAHLLVVPSLDPARFCSDFNQWQPTVKGGWLEIDPSRLSFKDRRGRFDNLEGWRTAVIAPLRKKSYCAANEIDPVRVDQIEATLSFDSMPVRVVTWDELMTQTAAVAEHIGMGHLAASCEAVRVLGKGAES